MTTDDKAVAMGQVIIRAALAHCHIYIGM